MKARGGRFAAVLLWGGAGLVLIGLILGFPRFLPYVESLLYARSIPTAPPLVITPTQESPPAVLMPFEGESLRGEAAVSPTPAATATPSPAATAESDATPTATPSPAPTATPTAVWTGTDPTEISVPSIELEAPVVAIGWKTERIGGQDQAIWDVPNYRAAGWHRTSSRLGVPGNTVLNGHNTSYGEVFRYLYRVDVGDQIFVEGTDGEVYAYSVQEKYILREAGQPLEVRIENARYIQRTPDERLTLVTCHPYGSLANRLILIAYPEISDGMQNGAS